MPPKVSPEYTPYATVAPQGPRQVTERVDITFPEVKISDAMGRAMRSAGESIEGVGKAQAWVANAFDNLGTQLEKTGNQLWSRAEGLQELQNENARSKAELEFEKYRATKQAQFSNLKGEAATEGTYKAYVKDLEDQARKLGEKLPPKTLEKYNASTRGEIGRAGVAAAGHVASEIRAVTIATSEARVNQWKDQLSKTDDINETKELIQKIEKEILTTQVPVKGMSKPVADEAIRKHVGEGYIQQLQHLARTNPWQALKILEHPDNKGLWDDKQYTQAKEKILAERDRLTSRNIATRVQESNPDKSLDEKIEEGVKDAKERNPDAPDLPEMVRSAIKERHHTHIDSIERVRRENNRVAISILSGDGNPDGVKPKTPDEFFRDGGEAARKAWDDETLRPAIKRQLNRNALGLNDPTPESEDIRLAIEGIRKSDPARFRDLDLNQFDDLRLQEKKHFENLQEQLRQKGIKLEDDPHVSAALSKSRANGWIDRKLLASPAKWEKFQGAFSDAIHVIQKQQGYDKPLSDDQIKGIALMLQEPETYIGRKFGFGYNVVKEGEPLYQRSREISEGAKNEILKDHPGISENEILERYRRNMIRLEWQKKFAPKYAY